MPDPAADPQTFVIERELAEVHLLLENISASADKALDLKASNSALGEHWLDKVCAISWPPTDATPVEQSVLLIQAKDFLNGQAKPATGATIAFTLLVTQDGGPNWFVRLWRYLYRTLSRRPAAAAATEGCTTRVSLARQAYPDLRERAHTFRLFMGAMNVGMVAWLIWTCFISWDVAVGGAKLAQLASANAELAKAQTLVETLTPAAPPPGGGGIGSATQGSGVHAPTSAKPDAASAPGAPPSSGTATQTPAASSSKTAQPPATISTPPAEPCEVDGPSAVAKTDGSAPSQTHVYKACQTQAQAAADVGLARTSLTAWLWRWRFLPFRTQPALAPETEIPLDYVPDGYAAVLVGVLGGGVLPVFYGILGAGAAVVRALSAKIKASTLTPRDLSLSLQRLALGAVVGACIGLFMPDATAASSKAGGAAPGLLGPVGLSPAALSFVAGFAVEAVFTALEGLIGRIFGQPGTAVTPPAK